MGQVTVDFFRVRIEDTERKFEDIIDAVNGLGQRPRNQKHNKDVIRLQESNVAQHGRQGDITKIRMSDLPFKAKEDGTIEEFDLAADEGMGEQAAFLYQIATETLALQRNRYSISPNGFAFYFSDKSGDNSVVFLDPVIELNAIQRMLALQSIRKFSVKLAKVDKPELFTSHGSGASLFLDLVREFKSPSAEIQLSMGHKKGSLPIQMIRAAARIFNSRGRDHEGNQVTKIEISGRNPDGDTDVLDLIQCRMVEKVYVESAGRHSPYHERKAAVRAAFDKRREELQRLHRTPE